MKTRTGVSLAGLAAALLLMLPYAPAALAQDQGQYQDQGQGNYQDPPTRAGRIGFVQGSVSFQPGGQGDWLDAVPNRPLTSGDNLWVDRDSRAEIQIGSTSIRLGPETSLTFLELGNDVTQLRLSTGTLFFRIRHFGADDTFEVDAPNLAFNVNRAGEFRLDVNQDGDQTAATVWRGEGEITGGGDSYRLDAGQQGTFSGSDQLRYDISGIGVPDDFGRWAVSRDERQDRVRSRDYVSDEMTGYEDLDGYGRWHEVAGYGNVWTPEGVAADWAPYRYGNWTYVAPWGWTWVEQEPWGFAPFHYGRWASVEGNWCWVPGPVAVRPVYSPALVAFVGGGGFQVGIGVGGGGGGGVGWFPLGPGEVFVPWYRTSPRYVQNVNVSNTRVNVVQVTNVYNNVTVNHVTNVTYVNQQVNSVTVVNHDTFVNARPVQANIVRVDQRQIQAAQVSHEAVTNIQPARQSVLGSSRPVQMKPPEQAINREVVATRQPAVVNRPVAAPGLERSGAVAPPPPQVPAVKMVKSAPTTEVKPLQSGQRGSSVGVNAPGAPSPRTGAPNNPAENNNNRGGNPRPGEAAPQPGAQGNNPRPGTPNNPAENNNNRGGNPRPGEAAPQPGAQGNNPRPGEMAPRPGAPENNNRGGAPRPGEVVPQPSPQGSAPHPGEMAPRPVTPTPENGRGNQQPNENPRPGMTPPQPTPQNGLGTPENNRPSEQVPRPGMKPQEQAPRQPEPIRPENARPNNAPPENVRPENARPESARPPQQTVRPENSRPEMQPAPSSRPAPPRPPETQRPMPEPPARVPEMRPQPAPPPVRPETPPVRQAPPPPEMRREPPPRPESRPAPPPPSEPARVQPRNERPAPPPPPKDEKPPKEDKSKDKPPQAFR